ncbi:MAG: AAA family ATPase, partial [Terriglobales bacterium]
INRTTPKTQSALLEAMNEHQVTADGNTYPLPRPFWVIATQNPAEHHGTYPLPESQLDRFLLRLRMGYPSPADERAILRGKAGLAVMGQVEPVLGLAEVAALQQAAAAVHVSDAVLDYEQALVQATRQHPALELGVSPRGTLMLHRAAQAWALLEGRGFCIPDDVKHLLQPVCAHRVLLRARHGEPHADQAAHVLESIADTVVVPE